MNTFGERIKYLRKKELHLTQVELAERLGFTGPAVTGWEKGTKKPTDATIKHICKEFHVNYSWLVYGKGDIFNSIEETLIDRLADEYNLSEQKRKLVERILALSDEEINQFTMSIFGFEFIKIDHQD